MRLYVAGKWEDRGSVKYMQRVLESLGHQITVDWTRHRFDEFGVVATQEQLVDIACEDENGVRRCDAFVGLVTNPRNYKGLWVEMGIAIAFGKPCYIVGNYGDSCIFVNHPLVKKFGDIAAFLEELKEVDSDGGR